MRYSPASDHAIKKREGQTLSDVQEKDQLFLRKQLQGDLVAYNLTRGLCTGL